LYDRRQAPGAGTPVRSNRYVPRPNFDESMTDLWPPFNQSSAHTDASTRCPPPHHLHKSIDSVASGKYVPTDINNRTDFAAQSSSLIMFGRPPGDNVSPLRAFCPTGPVGLAEEGETQLNFCLFYYSRVRRIDVGIVGERYKEREWERARETENDWNIINNAVTLKIGVYALRWTQTARHSSRIKYYRVIPG